MASRREPPRANQHAPSCPAYSVSAKMSSCTCGLTTPRKSKRPTFEEAAAKALEFEARRREEEEQAAMKRAEDEERAAEQRAAMEAAIMGPGTTDQQRAMREVSIVDAASSITETMSVLRSALPGGSGYPGGGVDRSNRIYPEHPGGTGRPAGYHAILPEPGTHALNSTADLAAMLGKVERDVSNVLDRIVSILPSEHSGYSSLVIVQRCRVCRAEIETSIANDARFGEPIALEVGRMLGAVGGAARKAYVRHRCPPVAADPGLFGMSADELFELHQELERDGTELVKRSSEIQRLSAERSKGPR